MDDTSDIKQNESQEFSVMRSVLEELRSELKKSQELTQSMDFGEAQWRDGKEIGLQTAIELLENALKK